HAQSARMGVDEAGADVAGGGEAQFGGGGFGERAEIGADRAGFGWQGGFVEQVLEPYGYEEIGLPAGFGMGQIGPFAGEGGLAAGQRAGGFPGEEIGQVKYHAGAVPALRHMPLEPHQLGRFHFRGHDAAGIGEDEMAGGGAFLGFGQGAVIEPDHGVPIVPAIGRDRDRTAVAVADDERAGSVEAQTHDMGRVGPGPRHGVAHGSADGGPYLGAV